MESCYAVMSYAPLSVYIPICEMNREFIQLSDSEVHTTMTI